MRTAKQGAIYSQNLAKIGHVQAHPKAPFPFMRFRPAVVNDNILQGVIMCVNFHLIPKFFRHIIQLQKTNNGKKQPTTMSLLDISYLKIVSQ